MQMQMRMHVSRSLRKWYASATRPTRHANPCRFSPDWLEPQPYSHSQPDANNKRRVNTVTPKQKTELTFAPGPPQAFAFASATPLALFGARLDLTWVRQTEDPRLHYNHYRDHDCAGEPQGQGCVIQFLFLFLPRMQMQASTDLRSRSKSPKLASQVALRGAAQLAVRPSQVRRAPRTHTHLGVALPREAPPYVHVPGA